MIASEAGHADTVQFLVSQGANIYAQNKDGMSALFLVIYKVHRTSHPDDREKYYAIIRALLTREAEFRYRRTILKVLLLDMKPLNILLFYYYSTVNCKKNS